MAYNWYCTREAMKRAVGIHGSEFDAVVDGYIESASREIDRLTHRRFIPLTATKSYPWPQRDNPRGAVLYLGEDLLAVTALTKDGDDATAIASTDYFLEPSTLGPPYHKIEIDLASSAFFSNKDTHQRAIRITGRWGYSEDTVAAGALAEADDGSETALDVTDASLIGVGDTILIGTEQMFVSAKGALDTTANTAGALVASMAETTVPVNTGSLVKAGEVILIDSEKMLVESISGNNLSVVRAYDGSTLATHANPSDVYAYRTLTVVRAVNGTSAAAHDTATAITRYVAPADIVLLCKAMAIAERQGDRSGWTGQIGGEQGVQETRMVGLREIRDRVVRTYKRHAVGAV